MRFVWAFAIACVVAATSVCPEVEAREHSHAAQLDRAPVSPQLLATRGHAFRTPALRLAPFAVPTAPHIDVPPRAVVARAAAPHALLCSVTEVLRSARGPPIA